MSGREISSVAIVGAGAMGAMYAVHFAEAGFRVALVASGERAQRLARDGIRVNGRHWRFAVTDPTDPTDATDATDPADTTRTEPPTPVDLVLVAVKAAQLAEAVGLIAPLVDAGTTIISSLNGLDSEEALAERYDPAQVLLSMAAGMETQRVAGEVQFRRVGRFSIGVDKRLPNDGQSEHVERVAALGRALDRAHLVWQQPDDVLHALWWKFMVNVGANQASALMGATYGVLKPPGPARDFMSALMAEVIAVGRAEGVQLTDADLAQWDAVLAGQPDDGRTSTLQDVEAWRPTEVAIFAGRVVGLGAKHGIPTPFNQTVLWVLSDYAARLPAGRNRRPRSEQRAGV